MTVKTFIDRPILAGVISVLILTIGIIGLLNLPIEQFPDIAPPTVRVSATYTGANAETVQKSVIVPLEESINGVEDMMYMTSTATNTGAATVTVYFKQGTDGDMAMVNVQNRVASAQGLLPAEVVKSGVTVRKRQNSTLKTITLYSPDGSYDSNFLTNYMKINIEPQISRIVGVGEVNIFGADYAMRIWLDPAKMAMYGLVPADIDKVLAGQNVESPTGTLGSESTNNFQYVLKYRGRYEDAKDYENMVIKALPDGNVLRLRDVATVELGALNYAMLSSTSGHPGANAMIAQTAGSNANEVIVNIDALLDDIRAKLPKGMVLEDISSTKDFLDASIDKVVETLVIALVLVVFVVYLFLHDLKTTLIPTISIIVSLVGTFAFIYAVGFTLNMLTLFAIVLVIGTVVDDSVVVVEAVEAKFEEGVKDPYEASVKAMGGLSAALITTTIVFMAVFIPVCFMGGTSGVFYRQFGLTMAVAVGISLINAMTLCPALSAIMMRPNKSVEGKKANYVRRFHYAFDRSLQNIVESYQGGIRFLFRVKWVVVVLIALAIGGLWWLMSTAKTGLVPQEDMGTISLNVQVAPGTNLAATDSIMNRIEDAIKDIPEIYIYSRVSGKSARHDQSASAGSFNIRLRDWSERGGKGEDINSVIKKIYAATAGIADAQIRASQSPMISGYGTGSGLELYVQDREGRSIDELLQVTRTFIDSLNNRPEISRAYTTFDTKYPQYMVDVDAVRCMRDGVDPADVLSALSGYVGGSYSSNLNRFTKMYRVMVQANPDSRLDTESLKRMYVRTSSGSMSSLDNYLQLERVYGSESLTRFNLFPAIAVYAEQGDGYSSGEAINAVKSTAAAYLPSGFDYEFGGMSREEAGSGNTTIIVFSICIAFIYLILSALYESLTVPLAIIAAVPFGLAGCFLFARWWGLENNIYMQIGLIMLIGLLAKTAILMTEYATARRKEGMGIFEAAIEAAKARFRPIIMTSATMVIGMLPLMFAHGVGANGNISVGVSAVGGLLFGTLALLLILPILFVFFQTLHERIMPKRVKKNLPADATSN
ncbi:MAG: efflux RND transporter permease subunit [Muribaculaceae bacterium]|nr:efflux RND transporter permease subunit [Muribaculaceae bacterium]